MKRRKKRAIQKNGLQKDHKSEEPMAYSGRIFTQKFWATSRSSSSTMGRPNFSSISSKKASFCMNSFLDTGKAAGLIQTLTNRRMDSAVCFGYGMEREPSLFPSSIILSNRWANWTLSWTVCARNFGFFKREEQVVHFPLFLIRKRKKKSLADLLQPV